MLLTKVVFYTRCKKQSNNKKKTKKQNKKQTKTTTTPPPPKKTGQIIKTLTVGFSLPVMQTTLLEGLLPLNHSSVETNEGQLKLTEPRSTPKSVFRSMMARRGMRTTLALVSTARLSSARLETRVHSLCKSLMTCFKVFRLGSLRSRIQFPVVKGFGWDGMGRTSQQLVS